MISVCDHLIRTFFGRTFVVEPNYRSRKEQMEILVEGSRDRFGQFLLNMERERLSESVFVSIRGNRVVERGRKSKRERYKQDVEKV